MDTIKERTLVARVFGGGFIAMSGLICIVGLIMLVKACVFVAGAAKANGQVIEMSRDDSSGEGSTFHPVFSFTDAGGIVHTQRSSVGSSSYAFEPGEKVAVLYDSAVPKHSKIDSFQTIWLFPLALTGFGLLSGAFSIWWTYLSGAVIRFERHDHAA